MMTMKEWEALSADIRAPRHWEAANDTCHPRADDMESVWASYNAAQVEAEQRRMIKTGVALALTILLGIGVGVGLERGWTAMNAEVIEAAK